MGSCLFEDRLHDMKINNAIEYNAFLKHILSFIIL